MCVTFLIANVVNYFCLFDYRLTFCVHNDDLWRYLQIAVNKLLLIRLLLFIFACCNKKN